MGWGDELIVTGQVRELQLTDKRRVRVLYEGDRQRWHESWNHNPRFASVGELGNFAVLRPRQQYLRPYTAKKTAERWTWKAWGPPVGELYFSAAERAFGEKYAGRIIVEPNLKPGASPNKEWGWVNWNKLAWLARRAGIIVTQLGREGVPVLEGVDHVVTPSMRHAAAVLAHARAAVLPEGGMHHVCAAVGTPAVVIFGGYIAPAVTGYETQSNIFTGDGLGCGMRVACEHCRRCMQAIEPHAVLHELETCLERNHRHQELARPVVAGPRDTPDRVDAAA